MEYLYTLEYLYTMEYMYLLILSEVSVIILLILLVFQKHVIKPIVTKTIYFIFSLLF